MYVDRNKCNCWNKDAVHFLLRIKDVIKSEELEAMSFRPRVLNRGLVRLTLTWQKGGLGILIAVGKAVTFCNIVTLTISLLHPQQPLPFPTKATRLPPPHFPVIFSHNILSRALFPQSTLSVGMNVFNPYRWVARRAVSYITLFALHTYWFNITRSISYWLQGILQYDCNSWILARRDSIAMRLTAGSFFILFTLYFSF